MRATIVVVAVYAMLISVASAQQPAAQSQQSPALYASAADVAALIAKAKSNLKPGQPNTGDWIVKVDSAASPGAAVSCRRAGRVTAHRRPWIPATAQAFGPIWSTKEAFPFGTLLGACRNCPRTCFTRAATWVSSSSSFPRSDWWWRASV